MLTASENFYLTNKPIKSDLLDIKYQKVHGDLLDQPLLADEMDDVIF